MNYTEPKVIYTCFPGGKHKVLTMSYDDGRLEDRRLVELFNRYGIRGTFNLNGGLPRPERIPESEWVKRLFLWTLLLRPQQRHYIS